MWIGQYMDTELQSVHSVYAHETKLQKSSSSSMVVHVSEAWAHNSPHHRFGMLADLMSFQPLCGKFAPKACFERGLVNPMLPK